MREKELRIALVCFGGVSLAVYMHGITKEILHLVRASCALHAIRDREDRLSASFRDEARIDEGEHGSESIYFEVLRELGRHVELRVIVDIIAGASAGGINGTMLARALAHDLPLGRLRDLWLENADVVHLLAPEARAGRWSKWILRPFIWGLGKSGYVAAVGDPEVRTKLSLFLRSRWFKPPLSGRRMTELMYDAILAMGEKQAPGASLLPSGLMLDLFVTVTDHYGYEQQVQIHDPPLIHEREHRHVLRFRYRRRAGGETESDFTLDNAPALAFAARATSSFPGAFPPARIAEIDELLAARGARWPMREAFISSAFGSYARLNLDPAGASFLDGSVLNNRPFREAISAIRGRPAYREVDRRLVYIDPDPSPATVRQRSGAPGFFAMLKGALSDIPSSEPVVDELAWVNAFNDRVRRIRAIVEEARPRVSELVSGVITASANRSLNGAQLRRWREDVHEHVRRDAGFAYEGYVRLKLASVRSFVANAIGAMRGAPAQAPLGRSIGEIVEAWSIRAGTAYEPGNEDGSILETASEEPSVPAWVSFLLAFDVDYRKRRLHFLIESQNRLYQAFGQGRFAGFDRSAVDRMKRSLYERLDRLTLRERPGFFQPATRDLANQLFATAPSARDARDLQRHAQVFVELHRPKIDLLIGRLAGEIDLASLTDDLDELLAGVDADGWHPEARQELLVSYLGFPYWDVLTFPVMTWREVGEFNEILVDRISPQDAHTLGEFSGTASLKGIAFGHFAGFLSRAFREKDYLLGRLHGLDRLIDLVCDSAELDPEYGGIDVLALKKKGFLGILDAEAPHLPHSADLVTALRRYVEGLGSAAEA